MPRKSTPSPRPPKLGQNFLADPSAARKIVDALGDIAQATVIEIGPGRGVITKLLADRARKLITIEYDRQLAALLKYDFLNRQNVEVIEADVLSVDFHGLLRGPNKGHDHNEIVSKAPVRIVGNLPYYITSDILLKLFAASVEGLFEQVVVMVQKEVADRLSAQPGSKDFGLLAATAQMHARVRTLFTLPPGAFNPPPKVYSAVVDMRIAPRFSELGVDARGFDKFLKLVFAQKRKTIFNNLREEYEEPLAKSALEDAEIPASERAEELTLDRLAKLYRNLSPAEG
ncbi:MAG TPA: 16S rRNA (adenine(1518)-N(6)/adenine(1519)-N(6))-dimethyltransferase RsmA [Terriglobales bacterium]